MNKTELVAAVAKTSKLSKKDVETVINAFTETVTKELKKKGKVQLVGFGTFAVNERPAHEGINPATKQKIQIAAKKVAKFKAGAELADAVNA